MYTHILGKDRHVIITLSLSLKGHIEKIKTAFIAFTFLKSWVFIVTVCEPRLKMDVQLLCEFFETTLE